MSASSAPQRVSPRRPAPAPARPRHLRVVRGRPAPGRRPPAPFVLFAALATTVALFALVSVNVLLGQSGVKEAEVQRRIEAKRDRLEQLQVDVARLSSLDRVRLRATQLGLVVAPKIAFLPAPAPSAAPASDASPSASALRGPARPEAVASPGRGGR